MTLLATSYNNIVSPANIISVVVVQLGLLSALVNACFEEQCNSDAPLLNRQPQIHRSEVDGSVTLDCSDARRCMDRTVITPSGVLNTAGGGFISRQTGCSYTIEWLRLAGCPDPRVPLSPLTRSRFTRTADFELRIDRLQQHDSGLWACQLVARQNGTRYVRAIVQRTFMIHVRRRQAVNQNILGGMSCMDLTNNFVRCREDQVCARQTLATSNEQLHQQAYGCVAVTELPDRLYTRLTGRPENMCHTFSQSRFCQRGTGFGGNLNNGLQPAGSLTYTASTSHCCYCFVDDCNQYTMDYGLLKWLWPVGESPEQSVQCFELVQLQRASRSHASSSWRCSILLLCVATVINQIRLVRFMQ